MTSRKRETKSIFNQFAIIIRWINLYCMKLITALALAAANGLFTVLSATDEWILNNENLLFVDQVGSSKPGVLTSKLR